MTYRLMLLLTNMMLIHGLVAQLYAEEREKIIAEIRSLEFPPSRADKIRSYTSVEKETAEEVISALEVFYNKNEDPEVRQAVVQTIGGIAYLQKLPFPKIFHEALNDEDIEVLKASLSMIGMTAESNTPPQLLPIIMQHCSHRSSGVRSNAVTALKQSVTKPNETQLALMYQATHDRAPLVRLNAVSAIWTWNSDLNYAVAYWLNELEPESDPEKIQFEKNTADFAQIACAEILHKLGSEEPKKLIPVMIKQLHNRSPRVRAAAARSLGAVASETEESRGIAKKLEVQKRLESLLDDEIENVRINAAIGLDSLKKPGE